MRAGDSDIPVSITPLNFLGNGMNVLHWFSSSRRSGLLLLLVLLDENDATEQVSPTNARAYTLINNTWLPHDTKPKPVCMQHLSRNPGQTPPARFWAYRTARTACGPVTTRQPSLVDSIEKKKTTMVMALLQGLIRQHPRDKTRASPYLLPSLSPSRRDL